jgi:DNA-binding response OmpR family regulator
VTSSPATSLIVEDDPLIARVLTEVLEDEGYSVRVAADAAAGRELLRETPDLLVLDLSLPDAFGGDLLEGCAREGRVPPTVIVSTFNLAELVARAYGAELVRKPFDLDAFVQAASRARAR